MEEIKITNIITEDITEPSNDGTPGSALYAVPFQLNREPSSLWADIFIATWDRPPQFSSMHRPGIASVSGARITLDGTTLEEVEKTHKATLQLCVSEANRIEQEKLAKAERQRKAEEQASEKFRSDAEKKAKRISFD